MFYIRADANEIIGMGHIMRCISIAEEIQRQGEDVTFIVADLSTMEVLQKRGFSVICLHSHWNDLETELDVLVRIVNSNKSERILVDSYYVTKRYLRTLQKYTETIYMDDINSFIYPVDKLVNYNIYAVNLGYEERYQKENLGTKFALGCMFAPLRKEFSGIYRKAKKEASRILITSGGTDNYNVIDCILRYLSTYRWFNDISCYVVVGKFHNNKDKLMKSWGNIQNIKLLYDVTHMEKLMEQCDIAVTAGGVTVYELMACGLPSVMYTLADNQHAMAEYMSEKGLIPWVGDIRMDMDGCMHKMVEFLEEFYENRGKREEIGRALQRTVDGKGCERLAEWLLGCS